MKGKNGTTSFLPNKKKGGQVRFSEEVTYIPNREKTCLAKDQAKQICKEIEKNELINIQIVNQGTKDESKVRNKQVEEEDIDRDMNPYQKATSNEGSKDENEIEQMINWSIFSNKIKYVDSCMNITPSLTIRPLEEEKHRKLFSTLEVKEGQIPDIIFDENRIRETYFDKYDGVHSEIFQATRFDESTDLSTTYLGKVDISKSYMSKSFYIRSKSLHALPKDCTNHSKNSSR